MGIMGGRVAILLVTSRAVGAGAAGSEDFGDRFQSRRTIGIWVELGKGLLKY